MAESFVGATVAGAGALASKAGSVGTMVGAIVGPIVGAVVGVGGIAVGVGGVLRLHATINKPAATIKAKRFFSSLPTYQRDLIIHPVSSATFAPLPTPFTN